jgi:hypothetical protein
VHSLCHGDNWFTAGLFDASAVAEHLNLRNAVYIGYSTGGGEVARYVAFRPTGFGKTR